MWLLFAIGSAFFAGVTSILAKCGIRKTDSTVATAVRTVVVLIFSWIMVFAAGSFDQTSSISGTTLLFLILSGAATGASWLCYFRALQIGDINKVVPIDKSSTVLTILLALIFLGEGISLPKAAAVVVIAAGIFLMIEKKDVSERKEGGRGSWLLFAVGSAFFASLTSILGKIGISGVESNLGTAIRTCVVLVMAWLMVLVQGKQKVISYKIHDRVSTDEKDWYVVEHTHEAIIDKETFAKAQFLHQRDTRAAPSQKALYLFSGFLRCADCHKSMTRKSAKGLVYYHCSTHARKSPNACTKHTIREDVLEKAVLLAIQKEISLVANLTEIIGEIQSAPILHTASKRAEHLLAARKKDLDRLTAAADHLYMDWRTGEISKESYRRMKEKYETREAQLKEAIANLEKGKEMLESEVKGDEPYLAAFLEHQNIDHLERGILAELVDFIEVHEGGGLTIHFKFADQHNCR